MLTFNVFLLKFERILEMSADYFYLPKNRDATKMPKLQFLIKGLRKNWELKSMSSFSFNDIESEMQHDD